MLILESTTFQGFEGFEDLQGISVYDLLVFLPLSVKGTSPRILDRESGHHVLEVA